MPSALETLVKILKLERDQGYKNTAVIGGLAAFSQKWTQDAHAQAKKPEHHLLVDELVTLMGRYEQVESKSERHTSVTYMLDRIMGRVPAPPEYQPTEDQMQVQHPPPPQKIERPPKERRQERERPPSREEQPAEKERPQLREPQPQKPRSQPAPERKADPPPRQPETKSHPPQKRRVVHDDDDGDTGYEQAGLGLKLDEDRFSADDEFMQPRGRGSHKPIEPDIPPPPQLARPPRKPRPQVDPEAASDLMRGLNQPVSRIRGIGSRMAETLEKVGIRTINDLLFYLPRRYDDYTRLLPIRQLKPDMVVTVIGTVRHAEVRAGKNNRKDYFVVLDDGSGLLTATFFGQYYLQRVLKPGQQVVFTGKTTIFGNKLQMANPEWEQVDSENLRAVGIVPVYPLTEGLRPRQLRRIMKDALEYWAERLPDYVPEGTLERADLADLGWALKNIHFPEGWDHLRHAKDRFIFDDLLLLQMAILGNRREWQSVPSEALHIDDGFLDAFIDAAFPYPLTGAQRRAIDDIRRDIASTTPMNRLLQGDVGSGKTAVAATAMAMAFSCGKQAAIMAPTSILAEQHYRNLSRLMENMPGERKPVVGLLTSALTTTEREAMYSGMADGSIDMVIGTQALIQQGVNFHSLGVAIIDEQHRFGVEQRGALRGKGTNPHLLVMTATPIPRTMALTLYADLDLSVMDEMPPGRIPIETHVLQPVERERMYTFVENQLNQGRQAFIVHPLVEASEKIDAASAVEAYEHLQHVFFRHKLGLLHGRMKPVEKDQIMADFGDGKFDVLVTTSVAEVGVDIPNASVIVIEGANRFGLAQLHQFRGRVGRGQHASYCLLMPDNNSPEAEERLKAMEETTDGFRLAEIDWRLRGPGDLLGTRQSGQALMQLAADMTPHLVELAQREARTIYEEDAALELPQNRLLAERVVMLQNQNSDIS
jgi:ATP-dependent DNA helicase RecG